MSLSQLLVSLLVVAVLQMENSYNALLVAIDPNQDEDLLPPEAFIPAGPITPEGETSSPNAISCLPLYFCVQDFNTPQSNLL